MACTACGKCVQDAAPGLISIASGVAVGGLRAQSRTPSSARSSAARPARSCGSSGAQFAARAGAGRERASMKLDAPKYDAAPPARRQRRAYPGHRRRRSTAAPPSWRWRPRPARPRAPTRSRRRRRWARAGPRRSPRASANVNGRRLLFFEPEGEHAAAAVTAGMSMSGLRATNFSSGQGIAYMHESLYAAVGKRLTYVLNVAGARHDQARAQRARGPRRLSRRRRHRLLPALREGRAGGGRPQPHRAPDRRAVAQSRHLRAGRLPHQPRHRVAAASPSAS